MKRIAQYIIYLIFVGFTSIFYIIPFWLLYIISDIFYILIYHLIGYRKGVVRNNLERSFPEKDLKEIKQIERKFYRHLSDVMLETVKGFTMTEKKIRKRYSLKMTAAAKEVIKSQKSYILVLSHQNNWEWGNVMGSVYLQKPFMVLYQPLSNPYLDKYIKSKRQNKTNELVSVALAKRGFEKRKEKNYIYVMLSDQTPGKVKRSLWVEFLHQDTPCIVGPEIMAKMYDLPVIYLDSRKVKRGYYEVWIKDITSSPKQTEKGEITKSFMRLLEQTIKNEPEHWLWSHRRWKRDKPEGTIVEKL